MVRFKIRKAGTRFEYAVYSRDTVVFRSRMYSSELVARNIACIVSRAFSRMIST